MNNSEFRHWLQQFDIKNCKPLVMGILNVTPDSFYINSRTLDKSQILKRVEVMLNEGVDILDIGGESTRPHASLIDQETELQRVIPIIENIRKEFDVCISIDSYKPQVMQAALEAGANMINDVTGLKEIQSMELIKQFNVPACVVHISGDLTSIGQLRAPSQDIIGDINLFFRKKRQDFLEWDIPLENLIFDPGIGFGKRTHENLQILKKLDLFSEIGFPLLIGASRKRFIGDIIHQSVEDRLYGSLGVNVTAYINGARIIRTHDVLATKQSLQMAQAIVQND